MAFAFPMPGQLFQKDRMAVDIREGDFAARLLQLSTG